MIKTFCLTCKKILWRSLSKIEPRNFCSRECYEKIRNKELVKRGKSFRYKIGHKSNSPEHYQKIAKLLKNEGHPNWKGEKVSYRGLHQWVRRNKGKPTNCSNCGMISEKSKVIQWANVDGKYHRNLNDFISLCASCHKIHDLHLSNQDEQFANR